MRFDLKFSGNLNCFGGVKGRKEEKIVFIFNFRDCFNSFLRNSMLVKKEMIEIRSSYVNIRKKRMERRSIIILILIGS